MTRASLDRSEASDLAARPAQLRPRDSATLMLLDRQDGDLRVLMGRRHSRHVFMPGKFVFPGGRTDAADSRVAVASPLDPKEAARLFGTAARATHARANAIALSAIRETYEEAGLLIGSQEPFRARNPSWEGFETYGVRPALAGLRFVARAITPPGRVRRFDTRFLAAWRSEVAVALPDGGPTDELEELAWIPLADARRLDLPTITATIIGDLEERLRRDPDLQAGGPAPFYRMLNGRFIREVH
jgi:8-oxo-dGTP pyrophosphatase MutT (NUDIX family)